MLFNITYEVAIELISLRKTNNKQNGSCSLSNASVIIMNNDKNLFDLSACMYVYAIYKYIYIYISIYVNCVIVEGVSNHVLGVSSNY